MQTGYVADEDTYDNGMENDKQMRNRGWMKAPDSYHSSLLASGGGYVDGRRNFTKLRKIIHRQHLSNSEHWLRFRYLGDAVGENYKRGLTIDYIELVPLHIVSDPAKPEDRH